MSRPWRWIAGACVLIAAAGLGYWRLGPTAVEVVRPVRATAVEAIYATGSVEPTVMLPIAPRVSGNLVELKADEGSRVVRGQVLARLEDKDLASTVDELTARAKYARENFERTQDLVRRGFESSGELDRTRSEMDAADASLKRAHNLRDFTVLTAPADGIIIRRDGEIGQYLPAGQALFTMSCCAPLRVAVEVDEEDILRVHVGQKAVLRTDALPGTVLDGEVAQITPKGDPVSRSYRVRIRIKDPASLKVGMTIDANLIVAEHPDAILVPGSAVQAGFVWVVRAGRLHRQSVKVGVIGEERTEILEGLAEDAHVVLAPGENLAEDHLASEHLVEAPSAAGTAASSAAPASMAGSNVR